jgi:AraC-like DNA-binding protein
MLFNPDEAHDGHAATDDGFIYRMLYVEPEMVREVLQDAREGPVQALPYSRAPLIADPDLAGLVSTLYAALAIPSDRLGRDALLDQLILRFALRHGGGAPPALRGRGHPGLGRARDFLHAAPPTDDISTADLAVVAGMSRFHLNRAFRLAYGLPPHAYRLQLRLAAAKALLKAGDPPAAVAAALGFADQSHFHRRFRGAFGVTPGQFAAALRS